MAGDAGARRSTRPTDTIQYSFPGVALVGVAVGFVAVFALMFRPQLAKYVAPVYALGQGFAVGAISAYYETFFNGIVIQAVGATLGVFAVMLVLYRTRIIRVTERFRRVIVLATLGVMAFYLVSFVVNLFGAESRSCASRTRSASASASACRSWPRSTSRSTSTSSSGARRPGSPRTSSGTPRSA